jgi:FixJ family two-component response regulator
MSGFDVQHRLAQCLDPVPVVAITGNDTTESRQRAIDAGAAAYLRKPVDDRVLIDAVMAAIGGKA